MTKKSEVIGKRRIRIKTPNGDTRSLAELIMVPQTGQHTERI